MFVTTLNTKTGNTSFKFDMKDTGAYAGAGSFVFDLKPASGGVKIEKPANAKPLSQVLNELGLGDMLTQYTAAGVQAKAQNSKRSSDMASIQIQLEAFFAQNGYYPSLADMNNEAWLKANMKSLDLGALADPSNPGNRKLAAAPAAGVYAYAVTNASGGSCESDDKQCAKYTLTATYEGTVNGKTTNTKSNLD